MSARTRIAAAVAGGLGLLLVLAQVVLPRLAASRISSRVGRYGHVDSVSVSAWPAVKLLWGSADSVTVTADHLALSTSQATSLLEEGGHSGDIHLRVATLQLGRIRLHDATLTKSSESLSAAASITDADVALALPAGVGVSLTGSEEGQVRVKVGGSLFGLGAAVEALAEPVEGTIVARPQGLLQAFSLTVFSNPHVYVEGIGASVESESPLTYRLTLTASLR